MDAARRYPLNTFREVFAEALREGWSGFTGLLVFEGELPTPTPDDYRPHRFRVKLQFQGRDFGTLIIEVAAEEIAALERVDAVDASDAVRWFRELGLAPPDPIPALELRHQIAQKLHACTAPDTDSWVNDRAHDLVDLQLAMRAFQERLSEIREAAVRLFASRRLHPWPPVVSARRGWRERYAAEAQGLDVLEEVDEAIEWANQLIANIDSAHDPLRHNF